MMMTSVKSVCAVVWTLAALVSTPVSAASAPGFDFTRQRLFPGFDGKLCKMQPSVASDGKKALLAYQKLLLSGSDVFYGQYMSKSADGGKTWSEPQKIKLFEDTFEDGFRVARYATVAYSAKNRRWFGLGMSNLFKGDNEPFQQRVGDRAWADPLIVTADPDLGTYTSYRILPFPIPYDGCYPFGQFVEEDDGTLLIPFYFTPRNAKPTAAFDTPHAVVTVRYRFKGDTLEPVATGTPLTDATLRRGLCEPSIAKLGDTYYITLRSDETGFVASGRDGLTFGKPVPWRWQDGTSVGNRNTQQHWLRFKDALYLAYTRETPQNGHVFRNRAPVWSARFDPKTMGLVRATEFPLVPELGARLGNFVVADVGDDAWLVTAEWMQPKGCERYGSDNSIWLVKAFGADPSKPFKYEIANDRTNAVYACGEEAEFTVTVRGESGALARSGLVKVNFDAFGPTNRSSSVKDLTEGNPFKLRCSLNHPGFLRMMLRQFDGEWNQIGKETTWGVAYEPERIRKASPSPADFDAYWAGERARLKKEVPIDAQVTPVPERSNDRWDYYRISFATFGRRVHGYMSVPKDKSKAPYPADVQVAAAGFGDWTNDMGGHPSRIKAFFSVYPFEPDWKWEKKGLKRRYDEMNATYAKKAGLGLRYCQYGIDRSREEYFFHPVILGIDRAVDWLAARPDVDAKDFTYSGTSQGGGFGFYLLGLNRRFTKGVMFVPAITDTMGYLARRQSGWPLLTEAYAGDAERFAAAERNAPYFDAANFASRIRCPVRVAVGFADTTCAPCAVYAAYNEIPVKDKAIVHGIGMGHGVRGWIYGALGRWQTAGAGESPDLRQ